MNDQNNSILRGIANTDESIFFMRMKVVRECDQEGIVEYGLGFIKANLVGCSVVASFALVPIEYQFHRIVRLAEDDGFENH
jgi:hypothetical protein